MKYVRPAVTSRYLELATVNIYFTAVQIDVYLCLTIRDGDVRVSRTNSM